MVVREYSAACGVKIVEDGEREVVVRVYPVAWLFFSTSLSLETKERKPDATMPRCLPTWHRTRP